MVRPVRMLATAMALIVVFFGVLMAVPASAGGDHGRIDPSNLANPVDPGLQLRAILGDSLVEWSVSPGDGTLKVGVTDLAVSAKVIGILGPTVTVHLSDATPTPYVGTDEDQIQQGPSALGSDPNSPAGRADALLKSDTGKALFGDMLTGWWTDPETGRTHVGVTDPRSVPPQALQALAATGNSPQFYASERGTRLYGRLADSVPWFGGIRLYNSSSGTACSANFMIKRSGIEYAFSAGHCGSRIWTNNGIEVGATHQRELSQNGWDNQIIGFADPSGGSPSAFTGCNSCSTSQPVKASTAVASGGALCFAGSYTAENCTARVGVRNTCQIFVDGVTTCHLSVATSTDGSTLAQGGDSGGTIYKSVSGGVAAAGMIVGFAVGSYYYHEMPDLSSHWGASMQVN